MDGPAGLDDPHQGRKTQAWLAISEDKTTVDEDGTNS
jgi:hypothetical protein